MTSSRRSSWLAISLLVAATLAPPHTLEAQGTGSSTSSLEAGRLLVARPGMADPNFSGTVVLLLSYGEDGAMGVIVNRPTDIGLSEAFPDVEELADRTEVLFGGGPVAVGGLTFVLRAEDPPGECRPVLADVCAGGSLELLYAALDAQSSFDFRTFAGHAGWAPGQLEWEIEQRGWFVLPGSSDRVFSRSEDELWLELVRVAQSPMA